VSKHLDFIRTLPCCLTWTLRNIEAAHIRKYAGGGTGIKPKDNFVVPLNTELHALQHSMGELSFWENYGGVWKAQELSNALYDVSGDRQKAVKLIMGFRR